MSHDVIMSPSAGILIIRAKMFMMLAGKSSRNVLRVLHDECVLVVPCFSAARLLLSCSCFQTGFQNEFFFLLCGHQCWPSWDLRRQSIRHCQPCVLDGHAPTAAIHGPFMARQHTASPKVLYFNDGHVSSSALTVQTWRLLLHRKNVLYAGVFFFFFIRGFPPELSLAERILVLMI